MMGHSFDTTSTSAILQRLADLESRLVPLSPHLSNQSESFMFPGTSALDGLVPGLELRHHSSHCETSSDSHAGERLLQVRSASSPDPALDKLIQPSNTTLGPWWGVTLEETLNWSGIRQFDLQDPTVIALTDRPLSEVCLPSGIDPSKRGSLPPAPDRDTDLGLDDVEEMSRFVEKFLRNIHIRNPLVEPTFLRDQIAISTEIGLQWNSSACLLVSRCS